MLQPNAGRRLSEGNATALSEPSPPFAVQQAITAGTYDPHAKYAVPTGAALYTGTYPESGKTDVSKLAEAQEEGLVTKKRKDLLKDAETETLAGFNQRPG